MNQFEGSAPYIVGQGIADPLAISLASAMLLRHSLDLTKEADAIEAAIDHLLNYGHRTCDIASAGDAITTTEVYWRCGSPGTLHSPNRVLLGLT